MESSAKYTLVGAFVLLSAVVFVAALFWLAEVGSRSGVQRYSVYFRKHSLDGLQVDSAVTMKGIRVGAVEEYFISPNSVEEVKVTLRIDKDTPVKTDTRAIIKRNLLTGLAFIDLIGSSDAAPLRTLVPNNEEYPVIPEGQSQFDRIAGTIPDLMTDAAELMARINTVVSEENVSSLQRTLRNMEIISAALAAKEGEISATVTNLNQTASDIRRASRALGQLSQNARKTLDQVGGRGIEVLEELKAVLAAIDSQAQEMSIAVRNAAGVFSQEITVVSQSVSHAAQSISSTVENFENPRRILAGPAESTLGPGEQVSQ